MAIRLLCCVAHPDDECFGFGGALALAADRGMETSVLCMTDGQAGSYRGDAESGAELGQLRREEFARSCGVLGVHSFELLDYQDGRLEFMEFSSAAERLVRKMRSFRPHVVLTFGLDGGPNTHADHMMVGALTTAAFHWAGQAKRYPETGPVHQAQRLYTATSTVPLPGRPAPYPSPWSVALDITAARDRKMRAMQEHTTQAPLLAKSAAFFAENGDREYYTLAADAEPQPVSAGVSLFDGLMAI
jgi:LmbE family N-acetylglucosaminyl deacetylase